MEVMRRWVQRNETIQVEGSTIRVLAVRGGQAQVEVTSPGPIATGRLRDDDSRSERDIDDLEFQG